MTLRKLIYEPSDTRLGRHVDHDPKSKDYAYEAASLGSLRSIRHSSHIGILNQGQVGSCTGNAATKCLSHNEFWGKGKTVLTRDMAMDEEYAVGVYSDAEVIDGNGPYVAGDPSTDHGSSGLSVAKVLQRRGLIDGYSHAFSLEAALTALSRQPIIVGIPWHQAMFTPDSEGFIRPMGPVEGGHEICVDELAVGSGATDSYVEFPNSWSRTWGLGGRARITWDDFGRLLADNGDVTIFNLPTGA